ncbi:recombination regulator RecX [Achromobacter pulmonis]|uniref:Regulatory protein RecX n=1 Tax=Achromobacter pulmonis TaxID=1389932 RepID=A0A2N8KE00_9BURK|nr:recombination regulator RecX [Achromobacter pulmonis]
MSWKPPPALADRLRARLDDEFETVARPEGLRRTSDARREQAQDAEDDAKPAARKGPSLKMRAVGYLSRREHARGELARKLAAHAEDPAEVEAVLDSLEKEGWLSNERFAQGLVHRRAARQGTARIVQELRQHGVDDNQVAELRDQLRATEYERALEVWKKRFQARPQDRAAYAKQARFLASRGFAHDVIRRILGEGDED